MNVHTRKAIIAGIAIVCITVLLMAEKIDQTAGITGITGITMYILGNGIAARTGHEVEPVVRRRGESRSE